jgi:hypothetical protein
MVSLRGGRSPPPLYRPSPASRCSNSDSDFHFSFPTSYFSPLAFSVCVPSFYFLTLPVFQFFFSAFIFPFPLFRFFNFSLFHFARFLAFDFFSIRGSGFFVIHGTVVVHDKSMKQAMQSYAAILTLLLRLRQACDHPFLVLGRDRDLAPADTQKVVRTTAINTYGTHTRIYTYVYIYIYIYACIHVYVYLTYNMHCMHICIHACTCTHAYIHTYMHACIHTYI